MVNYLRAGIFPIGVFDATVTDNSNMVSPHPDYSISASERHSFQLLPLNGNEQTRIKAFEVILGQFTSAQIGWKNSFQSISLYCDNDGIASSNASSMFPSFGDIAVSPSIGQGSVIHYENKGYALSTRPPFGNFAVSPSIGQGSVVRCMNKGQEWYVDGKLVASTRAHKGVSQIPFIDDTPMTPCFTIQGNLHVSAIELESYDKQVVVRVAIASNA